MPLIYIHCPKDTFKAPVKNVMVEELTAIALQIEGLPDTDFVRSTAWTYIREYETGNMFKGGSPQQADGIAVEVNVFKGGLDFERKGRLMEAFTDIIQRYAANGAPVYVLVRENSTEDWGVLGKRITLEGLFNPPEDALPI